MASALVASRVRITFPAFLSLSEKMTITFDNLITKSLDKVESAIQEHNFQLARYWYARACCLYSQHPTGNPFLEARKEDLYRTLFER